VADVLAGNFGSSSSSTDDISSPLLRPMELPPHLQIIESRAFQMVNVMIPRIQFPIVFDRPALVVQPSANESSGSSHLAIVPYQPSLHAVLITLWASAMDNSSQHLEPATVDLSATEEVENEGSEPAVSVMHKTVTLLGITSISSSSIPLESSSCRRSSRFKPTAEQFLIELEDNPKKKQRQWREAASGKAPCMQLLDNPPKPDDAEIPVVIPTDVLKSWGVLCEVSLEKLSDEALHAEKTTGVPNEESA